MSLFLVERAWSLGIGRGRGEHGGVAVGDLEAQIRGGGDEVRDTRQTALLLVVVASWGC